MVHKIINYDLQLKSTKRNPAYFQSRPQAYTNDENSIKLQFRVTDTTPEELTGATAILYLYMRDGSFFQKVNADIVRENNVFSYVLSANESKHLGLTQVQIRIEAGIIKNASPLYEFEIIAGLETKPIVEREIQDWTTLTAEAKAFVDQIKDTTVDQFVELKMGEELQNLESNYATRLTGLETNDNALTAQLAQKVTHTELDAQLATLLDGGPSIFMDTLAILQSTYPNGASGVALVRETDPARIYVWDGSVWKDFGDYQGVEVKDNSVRPESTTFIKRSTNLVNFEDLRYGEMPSTVNGQFVPNASFISSGFSYFKKNTSYVVKDFELWFRFNSNLEYQNFGNTSNLGSMPYDGYYVILFSPSKVETVQLNEGVSLLPYEKPFGNTLSKIVTGDSIKDDSVGNSHLKRGAVSVDKLSFISRSTNLFNKKTATVDKAINATTGQVTDNTTTYASDFISVEGNADYTINGVSVRKAQYDAYGNFITSDTNTGTFKTNERTRLIRLGIPKGQIDTIQLNKGTTLLPYENYFQHIDSNLIETNIKNPNFSAVKLTGELDVSETVEGLDGSGDNNYIHDDLTVSDVYALYDALMARFPNYITRTQIGRDQSDAYPIYCYTFKPKEILRIPSQANHESLPKIILATGTHGDGASGDNHESIYSLYFLMTDICDRYLDNDILGYLKNNIEFKIVPLVNPWGVQNKSRLNSRQVDINRNFGTKSWSSGTLGTMEYGGTEPFSEAETKVMRDLVYANNDALLFTDFHTTGGVPTDDKWIYFDMTPDSELYYPAANHIRSVSDMFKRNQYPLSILEHYGYINHGLGGKMQVWVSEQHINACVLESAPNIYGSDLPEHRKEIMEMSYLNYGNWVINAIKFLQDN